MRLLEVINTTWENLQIAKHKPVRWDERTPFWFVLRDLQIFSGSVYHLEQPHAQSPFLFPIVFGTNSSSHECGVLHVECGVLHVGRISLWNYAHWSVKCKGTALVCYFQTLLAIYWTYPLAVCQSFAKNTHFLLQLGHAAQHIATTKFKPPLCIFWSRHSDNQIFGLQVSSLQEATRFSLLFEACFVCLKCSGIRLWRTQHWNILRRTWLATNRHENMWQFGVNRQAKYMIKSWAYLPQNCSYKHQVDLRGSVRAGRTTNKLYILEQVLKNGRNQSINLKLLILIVRPHMEVSRYAAACTTRTDWAVACFWLSEKSQT